MAFHLIFPPLGLLKPAGSEESGWTSQKKRLNRKESLLMWKVFCIWTAVQVAAVWVQVTVHRHSTYRCNPAIWFMRLLTSIQEPVEELLVRSCFNKREVTGDTALSLRKVTCLKLVSWSLSTNKLCGGRVLARWHTAAFATLMHCWTASLRPVFRGQAAFSRSELVDSRHLHQFMSAFITYRYLAEVQQSKQWPQDEGMLLSLAKRHLLSDESLIGNLIGQGSLGTKLFIYGGNDPQ